MAAAYAVLLSLFNDLELILNHPRHSFSFENKQIQSLLQIVTFLIEFMDCFDNIHGPTKEAAQLLEMPITRAALAAKKVVESRVADQILAGSTMDGKKRSRFFFDLQKVIEGMEFVERKAIKVSKALKQQPTYSVATAPASSSSSSSSSSKPLSSEKSSMVGFNDVLLRLLDLLTGYPSSRQVISITGTGGIGKTTLAKNAFQHGFIVEHFDVCLWATISQQYAVHEILLRLLEKKLTPETVGNLEVELYKKLYGRRYLVVLDDVWSVEAWDEIKSCFPDTSNGSRVVVTTRQSNIAHCIGSSHWIAVDCLDEEKSWDLFCEKTFGAEGCPLELEEVGKKIVKKCKGLPLAIIVLAGHLRMSSRVQEYWENVANNMRSVFNSEENKKFLDVLSFSYSQLPSRLKPCFIYFGIYREDENIYVSDLIDSWVREGFIKPCKNEEDLEAIGKNYLKDLIDRNLIFPSSQLSYSDYVGIHDVLRELCIEVAEKEMFFDVVERKDAPQREQEQLLDSRLLRLLRKRGKPSEYFFEAHLHQVNLRYVYYRGSKDQRGCLCIRSPLSQLWNLQTLIIDMRGWKGDPPCAALHEFWEMTQLRMLVAWRGIYLPDPTSNDQVMRNLHTLWRVHNFRLSEEVCQRIPNIKLLLLHYSEIAIELPSLSSYYCLHHLSCFRKLESLDLEFNLKWDDGFGLSLKLPSSLKKLKLEGCRLDWEEITRMAGYLPHLERLRLVSNSFIRSEWTLSGAEFRRLKFLSIRYCSDLVYWNADSSNFPVLEGLLLIGLSKLDKFPLGMGEIPTLRSICLHEWGTSESLLISAARVVMGSQEYGNDDLQLKIDFYTSEAMERFNKKLQEEGLTINNLLISGPG